MEDKKVKNKKGRNPDSIKKENLKKLEAYLEFSKNKLEKDGNK